MTTKTKENVKSIIGLVLYIVLTVVLEMIFDGVTFDEIRAKCKKFLIKCAKESLRRKLLLLAEELKKGLYV